MLKRGTLKLKSVREKLKEFVDSTIEAFLALASLAMDAGFWIVWAYITKLSGEHIAALEIESNEVWPYHIAQWSGCGVLALFVVFRTIKDVISLWDSLCEYLNNR